MKDYSFGNYICALRTGLGLSQFQLGNLVGVSDKAVSKWENGDAKPRIGTCYRLAEVLGVTINELLSCNTALPARKELDNMKRKLWNEAQKRLSIYGDTPPVLCWSRLAAEKAALEETDAILSMAVLAKIVEEAEKRNTLVVETGLLSNSFTAWLLGASKVNPLPAHYRCPYCGKTELVPHGNDGFDLPAKKCICGTEMIRDGHNLPYDNYVKSVVGVKAGVDLHVSSEFMPIAAKIIKDFYQGKAEILPVKFTDTDDDMAAISERYVILSDREDVPPVSRDGFWHADSAEFWYWWKNEIMYTLVCSDRIRKMQYLLEQTQTTLPNPLKLISPEMFESLYQRKCCDPAHSAALTKHLCEHLSHNFELLTKLDGFSHSYCAWCNRWVHNGVEMFESNGEKLVREGRATILDIPAFREDIWNDVSTALSQRDELVQSLDKKALWKKAKPTARQKFISHSQFCRVISDIGLLEEFNQLYYQTLFRCVYEGIYNDDMSVLKNLRGSDIHGECVTLHEDDGHSYTLKISSQLAADLAQLSEQRVWERKNRNGICRIHMRGLYSDSVFKIEERKTSSPSTQDSYRFTFYAKLRKIADDYLDFRILPFQLYISGIMYRIILRLNQNEVSVTEAFADNSRNRKAFEIVSAELSRCNYTSEVGNFREIVKGHLDSF